MKSSKLILQFTVNIKAMEYVEQSFISLSLMYASYFFLMKASFVSRISLFTNVYAHNNLADSSSSVFGP